MKKLGFIFVFIVFFTISNVKAEDITKDSVILIDGQKKIEKIMDRDENTFLFVPKNEEIRITGVDIFGVYILYERQSSKGILKNSKKNIEIGNNGFLHEYIAVDEVIGNDTNLTITYEEDVCIAEIYILGKGELPDFVEVWQLPSELDLLLFSTHSDDELIFFLGLLPTYVARGANVGVVYFTNHYADTKRLHEQLHGLYKVGVRNYPIIGIVPDEKSYTLEEALGKIKTHSLTEEDLIRFDVEILRKLKPLVVVSHDENGEYAHGQHMLTTYVLKKALEKSNDASYGRESYQQYGAWNVYKTYLHLYSKNEIVMDYDSPLDYFDGKTAYEVSIEGYREHKSQQNKRFTKWITGEKGEFTKASEIQKYSPMYFGLYRSLVGEDVKKQDMFENLEFIEDRENDEKLKYGVLLVLILSFLSCFGFGIIKKGSNYSHPKIEK